MTDWQRIKLRAVSFLVWDAPDHLRWCWVNSALAGETKIYLVSPRQVVWELKLNGGAWIKRLRN